MSSMSTTVVSALAIMVGVFLEAGIVRGQAICYVDDDGDPNADCSSWANACPELQTALDLAGTGDQVWVAAGSYNPDYDADLKQRTGDRTASFRLVSGIALYGGFNGTEATLEQRAGLFEQTILSGDLATDDDPVDFPMGLTYSENSYHVVTGTKTDSSAVLDGFVITGGSADGGPPNNVGGGMFNAGGDLILANCTFVGNAASFLRAGNGAGLYNNDASPQITNCTFLGNCGGGNGGGMYNFGGRPTVTTCTFGWNWTNSSGGGMCNGGSHPTVSGCTFEGNMTVFDGGGMFNLRCAPKLTNSVFRGNTATGTGGGMFNNSSDPTLTNCAFTGNTAAGNGGAMFTASGNPQVVNCTFGGNSANRSGGGISCDERSTLTIVNSILWGNNDRGGSNETAQLHVEPGATATVSFSLVAGLEKYSGPGNIDANPRFSGPGGADGEPLAADDHDYRLAPGSPCIDAGDNTALPVDEFAVVRDPDVDEVIPIDLAGHSRFVDDPETEDTGRGTPPIIDMGAYEVQSVSAEVGRVSGRALHPRFYLSPL